MLSLSVLEPDTTGIITGVVLWRGKSPIDHKPIACVATFGSSNAKTGNMIQTWIIRTDIDPVVARRNGDDYSVCGDCALRAHVRDGKRIGSRCYVQLHLGVMGIFRKGERGGYPAYDPALHAQYFEGAMLRMGSYGDPYCVPMSVWNRILPLVSGWTGYTHQWRRNDKRTQALKYIVMASINPEDSADEAQRLGWRTFHAGAPDSACPSDAISCPAPTHGVKCADCGLCSGLSSNSTKSIWIAAHGGKAVMNAIKNAN